MKTYAFGCALAASVLLSAGCGPSGSDNSNLSSTNQTAQNIQGDLSNAWQSTKESSSNAWDHVKSSMQSTGDYTYEHKDAFVAKTKAELDALDVKIQEWSDKAANAADSAKADAQAKLQDLRSQRGVLNQKFEAVKKSTDADWNDVKAGFENSYDSTTNSVRQAWQWLSDKVGS